MKAIIFVSIIYYTLLFKKCLCIHNGTAVDKGDVPFQVALFNEDFICSGTLISNQWVLTAAYCTGPQSLKVVLGTNNKSSTDTLHMTVLAENITVHPNYSLDNYLNDIALLKLPEPVPLSQNIQPIELADDESYDGANGRISGWGVTKRHSGKPDILKASFAEVISNDYCEKMYDFSPVKIQESHVCTKGSFEDPKGACDGDTGAPLVVLKPRLLQVGIASRVQRNCQGVKATIYTRISKFKEWIQTKIEPEPVTEEMSEMIRPDNNNTDRTIITMIGNTTIELSENALKIRQNKTQGSTLVINSIKIYI